MSIENVLYRAQAQSTGGRNGRSVFEGPALGRSACERHSEKHGDYELHDDLVL